MTIIKNGLLKKDPPLWVVIALCLLSIAIIYSFKTDLPRGNEVVWAWYLAGIGCIFIIESLVREFYIKNRLSSFIRGICGIILLLISLGIIYGFHELTTIYLTAILTGALYLLLCNKRIKKDIKFFYSG